MSFISELKNRVMEGKEINIEESLRLYSEDNQELYHAANEIREKLCGDKVDLCSIINGKSGRCSENCRYCAQSIHFNTGIEEYPLLPYEKIRLYYE